MPLAPRSSAVAAAVLLAVTVLTGCSAGDPAGDAAATQVDAGPGPSATDTAVDGEEATGSGPSVEEGGPPPAEEEGAPEPPAEGGAGQVSVELAGLPVGENTGSVVDGAWCKPLFSDPVPEGVQVQVVEVHVQEAGATVLGAACEDRQACEGATFDPGETVACALLVEAPPGSDQLHIRMEGRLLCPDRATCDAVEIATAQTWTVISAPFEEGSGGSTGEPTDDPSNGDGTQSDDRTTDDEAVEDEPVGDQPSDDSTG